MPTTITSLTLNQGESKTVYIDPADANEQPGSLTPGNVPTWATSDPSIVTVSPAADGMSALVTALSKAGTANVLATGNSIAFGPSFTSTLPVTVNKGPANHFKFSV